MPVFIPRCVVRRGCLGHLTLNWYPEYPNVRGLVTGFGDDDLKLGAIKMLTDGGIGSAGALMLEDYENPVGTRGECNYTQEELDEPGENRLRRWS